MFSYKCRDTSISAHNRVIKLKLSILSSNRYSSCNSWLRIQMLWISSHTFYRQVFGVLAIHALPEIPLIEWGEVI